MFKKIDKVLAAMGNMKAMQRLHVDTFTEDLIKNVKGDKIAHSNQGQLYAGISELNDYLFLEITVICGVKIKTFNGATLRFASGDDYFELKSDTQEIDSDHSNVSNRYMAQISFDVTKDELDLIRTGQFETVELYWKKKGLQFHKAFEISDEEE